MKKCLPANVPLPVKPTHRMLEAYFERFRNGIIGADQEIPTPAGPKKMIYADWIASGRLYRPIEDIMLKEVAPFCANTHSETSLTGMMMTRAYHESKQYIKRELNAGPDDILIFSGSGMTDSINKLQRMLGLRVPEKAKSYLSQYALCEPDSRPVVFITHMEHHSNHTSWLMTMADVEIIQPDEKGGVDLDHLEQLLHTYRRRPLKIASVIASSNVSGVFTPYHEIAGMMHREGGLCFVDFACSGPYTDINMRPERQDEYLDAVFLSPHKFLGGPGTPGILVINRKLMDNDIPDVTGGGTVKFTSPYLVHEFIDDIEEREDGGTPPFLQGIRAALCFRLKKEMGVTNIHSREKEILPGFLDSLSSIRDVSVVAGNMKDRVGAVSFYVDGAHYNLVVRLLNDHFGIQSRGGCACAGTYIHYVLDIDRNLSLYHRNKIVQGELFEKPGWIRLSIHPTHTDAELSTMLEAVEHVARNHRSMAENYNYRSATNSFHLKGYDENFENSFVDRLYR